MSVNLEQIVEKLKEEINGRNRKHVVDNLEEILFRNFKELSINESFYQLRKNSLINEKCFSTNIIKTKRF